MKKIPSINVHTMKTNLLYERIPVSSVLQSLTVEGDIWIEDDECQESLMSIDHKIIE